MLKLFQTGRCGRTLFIAALVALLAFDWAKDPIERFLANHADEARLAIMSGDASADFREAQRSMQRDMEAMAPGQTISAAERALRAERFEQNLQAFVKEAPEAAARNMAIGSAHVGILVLLGFITLAATIWLVFARVRDIAWPSWVGFAVLAPALLLKLQGAAMPAELFYAVQACFAAGLVGLGLVPKAFGGSGPAALAMPPAAAGASKTARFGQRG